MTALSVAQTPFWQLVSSAKTASGFAFDKGGRGLAALGYDGVVFSSDHGDSWTPINSGLPKTFIFAVAISPEGYFYAGTYGGLVCKSTDGGTSWHMLQTPIPFTINAIAAFGSGRVLAGAVGFYCSTDDGVSWNSPITQGQFLAITQGANGEILVGGDFLARSLDSGATWTQLPTGPIVLYFRGLAVDASGRIFVGSAFGVFVSPDLGNSWSCSNQGRISSFTTSLILDQGGRVIAGGTGVSISTDDGQTWFTANDGLSSLHVYYLASDSAGYLFAATDSGIFRSSAYVTNVASSCTGLPTAPKLEQNYPNPFNPTTVIRYQLPAVSSVRLAVYDLLGRELTVLINERKAPGSYEVKFDGAGLASGMYFYRLSVSPLVRRDLVTQERDGQAGDFVQTRKLLMLR